MTAFESGGPERDFLICWINVLPSFSPVTSCLHASLLPQVVEVYGLLALGMSLWNQLVLPVLFMCFWLLLFALQIYSYFSTRDQPTSRERLLFLFLTR